MLLRCACLVVAALLSSCGAEGPSDGGSPDDAGRDAGRDGGQDAGRDGGRDAGRDAGRDGGPDDPGWVPLIDLGEGCVIERATRPEVLFTPEWAPCEEQPVGCERATNVAFLPVVTGPAMHWEGRGYYQVILGDAEDRRIVVLGTTDGPSIAAWREPRSLLPQDASCRTLVALGDGHVAAFIRLIDRTDAITAAVFHGPVAEAAVLTEPIFGPAPAFSGGRLSVSAETVVLRTSGGDAWGVSAIGEAGLLSFGGGVANNVAVIGEHVLWEDWSSLVRVAHATLDQTASFYRRADPGDIKGFRTDGAHLAWLEGFDRQEDGSYGRLELWAAAYEPDPEDLEPWLVGPMAIRGQSMYGGGWYVMRRQGPRRLEIVNVHDGSRRFWIPPSGESVNDPPLYATETEMLSRGTSLVRFDPRLLPVVE